MWGRTNLIYSGTSNIFSIDYLPSNLHGYGWLTVGTCRNIGVIWTSRGSSDMKKSHKMATSLSGEASFCCSNFNLKDQAGEVRAVRWCPLGLRMVTFDSWGTIVQWRNRAGVLAFDYEIPNLPNITDIKWSSCGSFYFTCADNGYVQLVSANDGQRIFMLQIVSTSRFIPEASFTSCCWNHDNTIIALGTTNGEIIELGLEGNMISSTQTRCSRINSLDCYKNEEKSGYTGYLATGEVVFIDSRSDTAEGACTYVNTWLTEGDARWSPTRELLAVVGVDSVEKTMKVKVLSPSGRCLLTLSLSRIQLQLFRSPLLKKPSSIVWDGQEGFYVSIQSNLHFVQTKQDFPSLNYLCQETVKKSVMLGTEIRTLPLPKAIRKNIVNDVDVITGIQLPLSIQPLLSWEPLFQPLPQKLRLHCSIDLVPSSVANQQQYILNLEHCGGVVSLLQATVTTSKIMPFTVQFSVRPASSLMFLANSELWIQSSSIDFERSCSVRRRSSLCRKAVNKVKQLVRRRGQLGDASNPTVGMSPTSSPAHRFSRSRPNHETMSSPVLAHSSVNTLSFRSSFESSVHSQKELGTLAIAPNYFRNEPRHLIATLPPLPGYHSGLILQSKRPHWNENTSVYELDFGGRINRDSVKNFQLEHNDEMVLQFGRVRGGCFCLDFEYPFSPIQAFCVGISCIL